MDHAEVGKFWDSNAEAWTRLVRLGCDIYRDYVNTPAFFAILPEVVGLSGLDIGCGEGHNTRLLAQRGAKLTAIDISRTFIHFAVESENEASLGIDYHMASAATLPFRDATFDFATAFMSFMDMLEHEKVIREVYRVLKPGGFLQFSILHPCFATPRWHWVHDTIGRRVALACGDYFDPRQGAIDAWIFGAATQEQKEELPKFRIPRFWRTLSSWLNLLIDAGFMLEHFDEPYADDTAVREHPGLADTRIVAYFLIARCRRS